MTQQHQRLAQIIQKINIFKGLNTDEIRQVLQVAKMRTFVQGDMIYKAGAPSDEMLIALKGQLMVTIASGEPLGSVTAGHSIGEMGVFTGQVRSATVTAALDGGGITLRKLDVEILMSRNPSMYVKVLKNIVSVLCERMAQSNKQNEQHLKTIMRLRDAMEQKSDEK